MHIALIELPARFGAPDVALREAESLLVGSELGKPDLALFPEAALTGYVSPSLDYDLGRFAEPLDGPTTKAVAELAARAGCAVGAALIEREGNRAFNAFVVFSKAGELIAHYRKRHPWFPETWATAGDLPMPQFVIAGVRLSIAICFDVHFLEREQSTTLSEIDALLFPSAWDDDGPVDLRAPLLGRLAHRYSITIANANWGGGSPRVAGQGTSRLVGKTGELARLEGAPAIARRLDGVVSAKDE